MRSLLRNNERKNLGRPKMALPSSESSGSDATPMRGNTTAMNVNVKAGEWIDTERRTTESSAKRSLVGRMPLGMHPPPKLSLDPPDPSKAKVKYYHKYKDSSSLSVDKTELKKEKSDGSDKTNLTNNRKIMDITKLPLEKQLEYYKEKLLQLAKSHAALLATCHQKKRFGKVEIRVKPEHLRNGHDVSRATNQNGTREMKSSNPRRDNSNVLEEVTEEESTQVESTEDQLISFSQLTSNTIDDTKCDNSSKENAAMAREATTKGRETCLLNNSPTTIRHQDADCEEGTVNNATMLGDDSSFPLLSQESYNTYSISVPIQEYNQWKDIMQELHLEGLTDDPPETILQQFARNNSLMTRQSSMGQEESIFQELDDGQESLGTFPIDATKAAAQPQTTDISVHDASHIGFSQLSQLPVDLHDDSIAEHQEPSQLTQSSTMLDTEQLYSEEHGGSQRFEPRLLSNNASMTGAKSVDLPQQSQLTQTSIDSSVVNAFSPRSDRSPTLDSEKYHANDVSRNAQTSLSFNPEQDLKAGANSDEDEEETQLEDSQLTQLSLSSSIFHPFRTEQETRTSFQPVDSEEQTGKLKSLVVEASTKVSDKPPPVDPSQPTKKTVRVGVGVLVKDPLNPNKIFAGIRKGSHGAGELALPGGHLEMFESWEECAIREVKEETALDIVNVRFGHVTNDIMKEKHYITIFMLATVKGGVAGTLPQKQTSPSKGRKRKSSASGMSLRRSSRARKARRVADEELFLGDDVEEDFHDSDELVDPESMTPKNMEPDKCEGWGSYSWDDLISRYETNPNCIFGPLRKLLEDEPIAVQEFLNHKIGRSRR